MNKRSGMALAIVLLWWLVSAGPALPLDVQSYEVNWWTVDGGGGTFSLGDHYFLGGTVGQADAGVLEGGVYVLAGAFWPGGAVSVRQHVYLPVILQ